MLITAKMRHRSNFAYAWKISDLSKVTQILEHSIDMSKYKIKTVNLVLYMISQVLWQRNLERMGREKKEATGYMKI